MVARLEPENKLKMRQQKEFVVLLSRSKEQGGRKKSGLLRGSLGAKVPETEGPYWWPKEISKNEDT